MCGNKVVGLPGDKVFSIGGSHEINGKDVVKDCFEIVGGQKI